MLNVRRSNDALLLATHWGDRRYPHLELFYALNRMQPYASNGRGNDYVFLLSIDFKSANGL